MCNLGFVLADAAIGCQVSFSRTSRTHMDSEIATNPHTISPKDKKNIKKKTHS